MTTQPARVSFYTEGATAIPTRADALGLTARELECLTLICQGLRNKEIAIALSVAVPTVEFHLANARHKLDSKTREQAVARAVALRLVTV